MTTPPEPGWYDDPQDPTAQRYWDGQNWTPQRQRRPITGPAQPRVVPAEVPGMPAQPRPTAQPRAADWYPDPSGKPGLMYWDGQQWHADTNTSDAPRTSDDELPPERTSTTPRPQRHQALIAVLVVTVVVLVAGLGIASYLLLQHKPAPQTPTAAPSPVPTTQPAPPPGPKLEGLLLSPEQINAAMGVTAMAVTETYTAMTDVGANVSNNKACLPLVAPAEASVYAGSGWSAMHGQNTTQQPPPGKGVDEYVVSFPSAQDAAAFFNASAQRWPGCANQQIPYANGVVSTVGAVSNTNDTLSAPITQKSTDGRLVLIQRALTVANNVVIDVWVGGLDWNAPDFAAIIAHEIAAKVPAA